MQADRGETRDRAQLLITNPDMLHRSILPVHSQFSRILAHLKYIVVDEGHAYKYASLPASLPVFFLLYLHCMCLGWHGITWSTIDSTCIAYVQAGMEMYVCKQFSSCTLLDQHCMPEGSFVSAYNACRALCIVIAKQLNNDQQAAALHSRWLFKWVSSLCQAL